ncbi:hypothetical protein AB0K34_10885 [Actinomadura sp. NPDC049382]|uniref:hypothetical protein n=1 Tax=Actinomadura sp. NPDC049382 TaxID=3158220 RepID=UPI00342CC259
MTHPGISIAAAVVALTLAGLLMWAKRPLKRLEFMTPWFCLVGGIGLAPVFLRDWVNTLMDAVRDIPTVGITIPIAVAMVTLFIVLYDIWPKHESSKVTYAAAVLLPSLAPSLGGSVGSLTANALDAIGNAGAHVIASALGV